MKQARLEALKMAVAVTPDDAEEDYIMLVAEEFAQYIENGPKVVKMPTASKTRKKVNTTGE